MTADQASSIDSQIALLQSSIDAMRAKRRNQDRAAIIMRECLRVDCINAGLLELLNQIHHNTQ